MRKPISIAQLAPTLLACVTALALGGASVAGATGAAGSEGSGRSVLADSGWDRTEPVVPFDSGWDQPKP
ncbi:hypothetical protein ABZ135_25030 [Streptomyces sp. NPDC006339]|uniref:hypothetical protein n=1 Tax=Streptomyces sp. NPDC006339 TaxID=3156755 RepID=UPI0033B5238E